MKLFQICRTQDIAAMAECSYKTSLVAFIGQCSGGVISVLLFLLAWAARVKESWTDANFAKVWQWDSDGRQKD